MDPFFGTLILFALTLLLSEVLAKRPKDDLKPAGLGAFNIPTATEGRVVPVIWGTVKLQGPNVLWFGDYRPDPIKKTVKISLFQSARITVGYKYNIGMQLALCRGGPASGAAGGLTRIQPTADSFVSEPLLVTANFWDKVNEYPPDDGVTFGQIGAGPAFGGGITSIKMKLDTMAPQDPTSLQTLSVRHTCGASLNSDHGTIEYQLLDGASVVATSGGIDIRTLPTTFGTYTLTLNHTQSATISDYANLYVNCILTRVSGGNPIVVAISEIDFASDQSAVPAPDSVRVLRVWVGDEVIWSGSLAGDNDVAVIDLPYFLGGLDTGQGGLKGDITFHPGTKTQTVDTYLSGFQQISGDTPAYRGTCYVVWHNPGYLGTSTSIKPWAFEARRIPNGLGIANPTVNAGNDANPMNVLYEIITDTEWGLAQPDSLIDLTNFADCAETLLEEGNGFSMVLDQPQTVESLIKTIEKQIDGALFIDRITGKWTMNLARGGYDPSTLLLLDESNIMNVDSFGRGAWADTKNNVRVPFSDRTLNYKDTYAQARDPANIRLQSQILPSDGSYPGCKDPVLANTLAWRDLRVLAYPLSRASLVVDRSLNAHNQNDVVRVTCAKLGLSEKVMRIASMDLGELTSGKIKVSLVEDVFVYDSGIFTPPGFTNWVPPTNGLNALGSTDQLAFEAPRAAAIRDEDQPGVFGRIWCAGRFQSDAATSMQIWVDPNVGAYALDGTVFDFILGGSLVADINEEDGPQGSVSISLQAGPDTLDDLAAAAWSTASAEDCGKRLANLILINNELFAFRNVARNPATGNLDLTNGYRALLDSAPLTHTAGATVWLVDGNMTDDAFASGTTQNVKLLPQGGNAVIDIATATGMTVVMADRALRPYPPLDPKINGVEWATTADLDNPTTGGPGSTLDDAGIAVQFLRRDFRTVDEVASVVDESSLPADFPAANSTQYAVEVRNDPAGTNTLLFTTPWASGSSNVIEISRSRILRFTAGALPTHLRYNVSARHTVAAVLYTSTVPLKWDFSVTTSVLAGKFNFGVHANGSASAAYTAVDTGTFTLDIGTALATGAVQVSINGGAYNTVIAATTTTGTFAANSGDTIAIKHTQTGSTDSQTICILRFSSTVRGYGILTY